MVEFLFFVRWCNTLETNEVESIVGIVNGTTNFILSSMEKEGLSYEAALKIAQEKDLLKRILYKRRRRSRCSL